MFFYKKTPASNTSKQKKEWWHFCIIWGLDLVHMEDVKGEKKKKKIHEELNLLNCSEPLWEPLQKSI